jgi:glutathione S-transferase
MKLYYLKGACSLASYISLCEGGLKFETASIDLESKKTSDGEDFNAINPKGYAPALRLDNGEVLTENVAVLQYIADQAPAAKLAPPAGTLQRYRLVEWLGYINSEVHKTVSPLFYPSATEEVKQYARANLTRRVNWLEREIGTRTFLMGEQFTVADAYLFVVFGWFSHVGIDTSVWPNLKRYHERIAARPHVQEALRGEGLLKE